jgi:hypothetical protein
MILPCREQQRPDPGPRGKKLACEQQLEKLFESRLAAAGWQADALVAVAVLAMT